MATDAPDWQRVVTLASAGPVTDAPDWQRVVTLISGGQRSAAPDWQRTMTGPGATPVGAPSPPVLVQHATDQATATDVVTATLSKAPTPGNLLLAVVSCQAGSQTVTPTSGIWTQVGLWPGAGGDAQTLAVLSRVVQSGDGSTWGFTFPATGSGTDVSTCDLMEWTPCSVGGAVGAAGGTNIVSGHLANTSGWVTALALMRQCSNAPTVLAMGANALPATGWTPILSPAGNSTNTVFLGEETNYGCQGTFYIVTDAATLQADINQTQGGGQALPYQATAVLSLVA